MITELYEQESNPQAFLNNTVTALFHIINIKEFIFSIFHDFTRKLHVNHGRYRYFLNKKVKKIKLHDLKFT